MKIPNNEESKKIIYKLMYKQPIRRYFKKLLLNDWDFMNDAIETVQLFYYKSKHFPLKREFRKLVKEYLKQIPLIEAKSLQEMKK